MRALNRLLGAVAVAGGLAGCAVAADTVHVGLAVSLMDHGGVPKLVQTLSARGAATADLVPLQPAQALNLLAAGDLDAAIVESHTDAAAYVARHPKSTLVPLWRLQLVLLGPHTDPAHVTGLPLPEAFRRIATAQQPFVSLADRSGGHRREQELWVAIDQQRAGWYHEAGNGSRQALHLASERAAYILVDAATAAVAGPRLGALSVLARGNSTEALHVDLLLGPGRTAAPFWRTLADALPAAVTALPEGYAPLSPSAAPAASKHSR
jgi:tungstate transport system substrate-binding protein